MLNRRQENDEELNDEQEEVLDLMPDDFDPDPDNVPGAVSARLYENIGEKRIAAGVAMVMKLAVVCQTVFINLVQCCLVRICCGNIRLRFGLRGCCFPAAAGAKAYYAGQNQQQCNDF